MSQKHVFFLLLPATVIQLPQKGLSSFDVDKLEIKIHVVALGKENLSFVQWAGRSAYERMGLRVVEELSREGIAVNCSLEIDLVLACQNVNVGDGLGRSELKQEMSGGML